MYLILLLMTCTSAKVPCSYQRVKEPLSVLECGKYIDGKIYNGKRMFVCASEADLADLKATKGFAASAEKAAAIAQRLTSQIR